jgi:hypothetical protein
MDATIGSAALPDPTKGTVGEDSYCYRSYYSNYSYTSHYYNQFQLEATIGLAAIQTRLRARRGKILIILFILNLILILTILIMITGSNWRR